MIDPMKFTLGFLSGKNGIFGDSNDKDNNRTPKKTRKTGSSLSSQTNGIFTNNADDPGDVTKNAINSNIIPTHPQKRVKNYKGDSKTNSRSSYNNKDIKYQNKKEKRRNKVKPTVQNKRNSSDKNSKDEEDNDRMLGLQDRNQSYSSS